MVLSNPPVNPIFAFPQASYSPHHLFHLSSNAITIKGLSIHNVSRLRVWRAACECIFRSRGDGDGALLGRTRSLIWVEEYYRVVGWSFEESLLLQTLLLQITELWCSFQTTDRQCSYWWAGRAASLQAMACSRILQWGFEDCVGYGKIIGDGMGWVRTGKSGSRRSVRRLSVGWGVRMGLIGVERKSLESGCLILC